jgi:tetratricopeptide (TPR) repeat protein
MDGFTRSLYQTMKTTLILATAALLLASHAFAGFAELVKQGDVRDAQFKPEAALESYLPAEKLKPDDATLLVKIARQYVYRMADLSSKAEQLKSGRTALAYSERAVKLAPKDSDTHLALAICLGKLSPLVGNKERIEASYKIKSEAEAAVKLNPKSDFAWHLLGRWNQELAQIGGMTRALALIVYGGLPAASYDEAVKCFQKAIALNPSRLIHSVELGRTYALMGRKEEARKFIEQGLALKNRDKDDPETKERGRKTLKELE